VSDFDHFAEAERLLTRSTDYLETNLNRANSNESVRAAMNGADQIIARAQVHATLALAEAQERAVVAGAERLLAGLTFYEGDLTVRVFGEVRTK
jgi:hypothetical protein